MLKNGLVYFFYLRGTKIDHYYLGLGSFRPESRVERREILAHTVVSGNSRRLIVANLAWIIRYI